MMGAQTPEIRDVRHLRSGGRTDAQQAKPYRSEGAVSLLVPPLISEYSKPSLSECEFVQVCTVSFPSARSSSVCESEQMSELRAAQYATAPLKEVSGTSWIAVTFTLLKLSTRTWTFVGV